MFYCIALLIKTVLNIVGYHEQIQLDHNKHMCMIQVTPTRMKITGNKCHKSQQQQYDARPQ